MDFTFLDEDIKGMITPNEFTTMRMKSVHKAMKKGKQEVAMVLKVDPEKGCQIKHEPE